MLADAGSIPAISTKPWFVPNHTRPPETPIRRGFGGFFMPALLVCNGLNKPPFGHSLVTRWSQQLLFQRRQEPKLGQEVRHTNTTKFAYSTASTCLSRIYWIDRLLFHVHQITTAKAIWRLCLLKFASFTVYFLFLKGCWQASRQQP